MLKMSPYVLYIIVAVLYTIVLVLTWAANLTISTTVVEREDGLYCKYPKERYAATILGVSSMVLLLATHLLPMLASRCLCIAKGYVGSRFYRILLLVSNWVTFIIAEICLLGGSIMIADHPEYVRVLKESSPSCGTPISKLIFLMAELSTVLTSIFSIRYYFFNNNTGDDTGVLMTNA